MSLVCRFAMAALLAGGTSLFAADPPPPAGFSPERAAWEREYERRLAALPAPAECGALLRELTKEPHTAGTAGGARVADLVAAEYRKAGLEVERADYDVLLSSPVSASLSIVGEPDVVLARGEEPIASDPDTSHPAISPPWNAYAPSADLTAEVVYVNHGSAADYDALARLGVDVRGRFVLARYFGGYRGGKSLEAERRGAAGVLVYSDPVDDGWFKGDVYPAGPWGPESHVQRGSDVYDFLVPGDPLTPGWASTKGARRIAESESVILPRIPMLPLSARDAAQILKRLTGPSVPEGWQGVAFSGAYHTGPGPRLHLAVENRRETRTIHDVIGVLRGTDEPGRRIYLSNHHDAWVFGAVDPSSGTATLVSLARALGRLAREGWRPRRTIVFGSWDAEEFTLTGSTEWGEEHGEELEKNGVVCINVDAAASGPDFSASASPLLSAAIRDAARAVPDPRSPERSVADAWRASAGKKNVRSYATGASAAEELPVSILGSGSDYTVFFNRFGVPSMDLIFDGPYGVYHSAYDTWSWMATQGDPGFLHHAAMARIAGTLALRFANADLLPLDAGAYGREIARYARELSGANEAGPLRGELEALAGKATAWAARAAELQTLLARRLAAGTLTGKERAVANGWLISLERALLGAEGLPRRPWFRHLVYAPLPSYEAETLPAIREGLEAGDRTAASAEIARLSRKLDAARAAADALAGRLPPD